MESIRKKKVLLAKPGVDGHDIGLKVVVHALRNAGAEVVYLGKFKTAEQIATSAMQEDVDVIGISCLGGDHLVHAAKLMDVLRKSNMHIPVVMGGVMPLGDVDALKQAGVSGVFPAGSALEEIVDFIMGCESSA